MEKGGPLLKEGAETPYELVFVDSAEPKYSHKEFAGPQKRFSYPTKNQLKPWKRVLLLMMTRVFSFLGQEMPVSCST